MPFSDQIDVRVTDTSLRDGSHAKRHQFTEADVRSIVSALDEAGVPLIEVAHGDGLGGSSFNYGFSRTPERTLIKAAVDTAKICAMGVWAIGRRLPASVGMKRRDSQAPGDGAGYRVEGS